MTNYINAKGADWAHHSEAGPSILLLFSLSNEGAKLTRANWAVSICIFYYSIIIFFSNNLSKKLKKNEFSHVLYFFLTIIYKKYHKIKFPFPAEN